MYHIWKKTFATKIPWSGICQHLWKTVYLDVWCPCFCYM